MNYVDGVILAVPLVNKAAYVKYAEFYSTLFKEYGALRVVDCWGDDVPDGKLTSFPMAVKKEEGEAVVFSWVEWTSREARDAAWKKLMDDPRMKPDAYPMPFDGKKMIYGGFQIIAEK